MKAVVFDLDGTLVESLPGLTDALNLTLADLGLEAHSEAQVRTYIGDGLRMLLRRALDKTTFPDDTLSEIQETFEKHYAVVWRAGTTPYEGVMEMLESLKKKGLQLGVLSNKMHPFTVEIVEALFGRELLPLIYGQRVGIPKKPDPTALISICEEISLTPSDVMYVGDSTVDLETSKGAGTLGIGVTWGYHDKERLVPYGFPLYDSVEELRERLS